MNKPKVGQVISWKEITDKKQKGGIVRTFQLGDDPEIVYILTSGYCNPQIYHVIFEDGYESPIRHEFWSASQIKQHLNIEIEKTYTQTELEEYCRRARIEGWNAGCENFAKTISQGTAFYSEDHTKKLVKKAWNEGHDVGANVAWDEEATSATKFWKENKKKLSSHEKIN